MSRARPPGLTGSVSPSDARCRLSSPHWPPRNLGPRSDVDGGEISLLLGECSIALAAKKVRRRNRVLPGDGVRRARVGDLRHEGFAVRHTPTRSNALHVSASQADGNEWDDDVSGRFDKCFGEPHYVEENQEGVRS